MKSNPFQKKTAMTWISLATTGILMVIFCKSALAVTENSCSEQELFSKELAAIEKASYKSTANLVFVSAFDGFFPLPSRYSVWPAAKGKVISMGSGPFPFVAITYLGCDDIDPPRGSMEIGDVTLCEECYIPQKGDTKHFDLIDEKRIGKLTIKRIKIRLPDFETEEQVMYDDKQYLRFHDANKLLWQSMLDFYFKYKNQKLMFYQ